MPTRKLSTMYADELRLFPDRYHRLGVVVGVLVLVGFPMVAGSHALAVSHTALIAVVGAVGMMILTGFCGQVSLGHGAFLAVGAYSVAILGGSWGWPFWLALPAAGALAAGVGLLVGPFALRLAGLYLAIVTVGLLFLVDHVLRNALDLVYGRDYLTVPMHAWFVSGGSEATGAGSGLGSFRGEGLLSGEVRLYVLFVLVALFAVWVSHNVQRSRTGRAMMAVRDRDVAAAVLGVDGAGTKFVAFGLSSFFAGVAGGLYAFAHPVVTLEPFGLGMSVGYIAMVVLGGAGTTFGAVWGAVAFTVLLPMAERVGSWLPFPAGFSSENRAVLLFYPALCVFLVFEPLGLLGVWLRVKRYFLGWPFRY